KAASAAGLHRANAARRLRPPQVSRTAQPPRARSPRASPGADCASRGKGAATAAIAGRVLSIKVKVGDTVAKGDVLLLLEAMKMENEIKSPTAGVVKDIPVKGRRSGCERPA